MKANPEEFAVEKKTKDQNLTFNLKENQIECESEVKFLVWLIRLIYCV